MGLAPLADLPAWWRHRRRLVEAAARCEAALLVDGSALHEPVARQLRRRGLRVAALGAPKIWAYRPGRGPRFWRAIDHLLLPFRFEARAWTAVGAAPVVTGHPMVERLEAVPATDRDPAALALLPGSRPEEIRRLSPLLLEVADRCRPGRLLVPEPARVSIASLVDGLRRRGHRVEVVGGPDATLRVGRAAGAAVASSGTASLELAIAGCPTAIVYRVGALTAAWVRLSLRTPWVGLPNLVADAQLLPEFLQERARAGPIVDWLALLRRRPDLVRSFGRRSSDLREQVREPGGRERAVASILGKDLAPRRAPSTAAR
jgi:lipid-A-disaccharide synthase